MMNSKKTWIKAGIQWLIGAVFLYAGWTKIQNPTIFAQSISSFDLLPSFYVKIVALILPLLEIIVGGLLISGYQKDPALLIVCGLTLFFAGAMGWALAKGLIVDCGCFGSGEVSRGKMWLSLIRDVLLFIVSSWSYREELLQRKSYRRNENGEEIQFERV